MSQHLISNPDSQKKVNTLSDAREFFDPYTASSHGPSQLLIIPSPREVRSRDHGLQRDARNIVACFWKRFFLHMKDHTYMYSKIQRIWFHLLQTLLRASEFSIIYSSFLIRHCILDPPLSHWRNFISKWHDGILEVSDLGHASQKIPWLNGVFKAGKSTFKTKVCSKLADVQFTTQWIKEVEIAKCTDELMTSRVTTGRTAFSRLRYA